MRVGFLMFATSGLLLGVDAQEGFSQMKRRIYHDLKYGGPAPSRNHTQKQSDNILYISNGHVIIIKKIYVVV